MMKIAACLALALSGPGLASAAPNAALARPTRQAASEPAEPKKLEGVVLAQGKIKAISRPPKPRSVTYKDAVIAVHLVDVEAIEGTLGQKEILVFAWGMRDNKWTAAADLRVGQALQLSVRPWDEVAEQYGSYNRIELEGEEIFELEPYWAEVVAEPKPR